MKALITGGTGFVGQNLAKRLPEPIIAGRSVEKIRHLFADIAAAYRAQGLATPESLEDAWEKYKRVEEQAQLEIDLGLWE